MVKVIFLRRYLIFFDYIC